MRIMTAEEFTRDVRNVLDRFERDRDEVVIVRGQNPIARLVPGRRLITLGEAIDRLGGLLTDEEAEAWLRDTEGFDRPLSEEMRDPWKE